MHEDEIRYYVRRAAEEQAAAERAATPEAAHAHHRLSDRYLDIVEGRLELPANDRDAPLG